MSPLRTPQPRAAHTVQSALTALTALAVLAALSAAPARAEEKLGYDDTPQIPGQQWKVHDGTRPQPEVIKAPAPKLPEGAVDDPAKPLPVPPAPPPSDAIVLFDGTSAAKWGTTSGQPVKVENGALVAGGSDLITHDLFGDIQLHIEWSAPKPPRGSGISRCNSGVFFMGKYEVQILDSHENKTYPDGQAGAIYGQFPPLVNASVAPGEWNVFDILFTAPRFENGTLKSPAYITAFHNGVLIHNHVALLGPADHRKLPKYAAHGETGNLLLQALNSNARFRNIWVRPLKPYDSTGAGAGAPAVVPPKPPDGKSF